jgi:hypothetical protein
MSTPSTPLSPATFAAYIDESGDEGFRFERESSEWFVLSAVVTHKTTDLKTVKLVDSVRTRLGKPPEKPLHFRDLKHEQRLPFVGAIAAADLRVLSVLLHKPSLTEPEKFQERYRLYFYCTRYLLERISWYCRDSRPSGDAGDGGAEVVFSNRSGMAYEEMREHFRLLRDTAAVTDCRIDWNVINPDRISAYSSGKRMGLQIADAVASSFFSAVQPSRYGYCEDRYARMLKPVTYHYRGRYLGYGLKFWPGELAAKLKVEERFDWIRSSFVR